MSSVGSRLAFALLTLLVMSMITFAATGRSAEDVAMSALGREVTTAQIATFIQERGLDRPVPVRYWAWLANFARGDFGTSLVTERPVMGDIVPRLEKTMILALTALLVGIPIAMIAAVFMAQRAGHWSDVSLLMATTVMTALPEFVIGIALIFIFGVSLGWLPINSTALMFGTTFRHLDAYVLPVATLVLVTVPYTVRIARSAVRESLAAPHTRAAILRGLSRQRVLWRYAVLPASVPIVNTLALNLVYLISGVVVIENVFGFPGIGRRLVEAITTSDTVTVQAIALVMGAIFIGITFLADLLAAYLNPRLRAR